MALSVVVPVYNGAATIGDLVRALRALEIEGGLEIVLVVDGSPDNSLDVCKMLAVAPGAPVTVLSLSRNFGEHNAVMAGLSPTRAGDYVITMDDDLQNPPEEVRPPVRARPRRKIRRRLHLLREEGTRGVAQHWQPIHELVRRSTNRQAPGALSFQLPLHLRLRAGAHYSHL